MIPRLPIEVWEQIIDCSVPPRQVFSSNELSNHDIRTLRSCALTCRDWLSRARSHLHCVIYIHSEEKCLAFCKLLESLPELGDSVRVVDILCSPVVLGWMPVQRLVRLDTLRLNGMDWTRLDEEDRDWFSRCQAVENLELKSGAFRTTSEFGNLVQRFPRLKRLSILSLMVHNQQLPDINNSILRLDYLNIAIDNTLHGRPLTPFIYACVDPAIRKISFVNVQNGNFAAVVDLLQSAGSALEHVGLDIKFLTADTLQYCSPLVHNTALISVQFGEISLGAPKASWRNIWVPHLLSQITSAHVQYIEFNACLGALSSDSLHSVNWSSVDEILAGHRFRQVRRLTVTVTTDKLLLTERIMADMWQLMKECLPGLAKRGGVLRLYFPSGFMHDRLPRFFE